VDSRVFNYDYTQATGHHYNETTMKRKVIKVGDSAAVIIPKKSMKGLSFDIGDEVEVKVDEKENKMIIEPEIKIDKELIEWTDKFLEENRSLLEKLAKE